MSLNNWARHAFTPPYTADGRSSIVKTPPWHYAGWIVNVSFRYDATIGRAWVPSELGVPTGVGCVHFADWQACTDGHELEDPVYSQYKETIVVVQVQRPSGELISFCPGIWVDQDISIVRGLLTCWPKKQGNTWLTRSLPIDTLAAAPIRKETRLGASLSVKERRFIEAKLTLTAKTGRPYGFFADPYIGLVGLPDLSNLDRPPVVKLVAAIISKQVSSGWHDATATLQFLAHPYEEISILGQVSVDGASAGWVGLTVEGTIDV